MNGLMHFFQRRLQRHVALDGRQVIGKIGQLFIRDELLSLRAFDLFNMGIQIIQIIILRDELQSRLLADPRHAGDIICGIPHERLHIDHLTRLYVVLFKDRFRRHGCHIRDPLLREEDRRPAA